MPEFGFHFGLTLPIELTIPGNNQASDERTNAPLPNETSRRNLCQMVKVKSELNGCVRDRNN